MTSGGVDKCVKLYFQATNFEFFTYTMRLRALLNRSRIQRSVPNFDDFCFKTRFFELRQHLDYIVFNELLILSHDNQPNRLETYSIVNLELPFAIRKNTVP